MITSQSEIKALLKNCPVQGPRAVSASVSVLEKSIACTDSHAKIHILPRWDWLLLGIYNQLPFSTAL